MSDSGFDMKDFRRVCGKFPTGVTVTTLVGTDGKPYGITLSSFTSLSLAPPLVLVCIDHRAAIFVHFGIGKHFGINILSEGRETCLSSFPGIGVTGFSGSGGGRELPVFLCWKMCPEHWSASPQRYYAWVITRSLLGRPFT